MEMKKIIVLCALVLLFESCKDKELLTGDIIGRITVYNQDLTASADNSGVAVSLNRDKTLMETKITDIRGQYRFENVPYGRYSIDLIKENYVKPAINYTFNHVGGYS